MIVARPATRADVDRWYPGETCSFRAQVVEVDGKPAGIIGLSLTRPIATLFSAFDEPLRPHLRSMTVLRLIRWAGDLCSAHRLPVMAIVDPDEGHTETAPKMLARLGFERVDTVDGTQYWRYG